MLYRKDTMINAFQRLPVEAKAAMETWLKANDYKGIGKSTWDAIENNPKTSMASALLMYIAFRSATQGIAGAMEAVNQGWNMYGNFANAQAFIAAMDQEMYGQMALIAAPYGAPMAW